MRLRTTHLLLCVTVLWFLVGDARAVDPVASTIVALRIKRGQAIIRENETVLHRLERESAQPRNESDSARLGELVKQLKAENTELRTGDKHTPLSNTPEAMSALIVESSMVVDTGNPPAIYSGEVRLEGLGKLTFPAGQWQLEERRSEGDSNRKTPDFFIYRKSGNPIERLTILRYNPTIAPPLPHLLDYLGESVGTGIPRDSSREKITGTHVFLHAEPADLNPVDGHLAYSFVFDPQDESPRWLCHCFLFTREGWDFVIVHTSTSVTSPEIAQEVFMTCAFDTK